MQTKYAQHNFVSADGHPTSFLVIERRDNNIEITAVDCSADETVTLNIETVRDVIAHLTGLIAEIEGKA
jgi:hypothetical protein